MKLYENGKEIALNMDVIYASNIECEDGVLVIPYKDPGLEKEVEQLTDSIADRNEWQYCSNIKLSFHINFVGEKFEPLLMVNVQSPTCDEQNMHDVDFFDIELTAEEQNQLQWLVIQHLYVIDGSNGRYLTDEEIAESEAVTA